MRDRAPASRSAPAGSRPIARFLPLVLRGVAAFLLTLATFPLVAPGSAAAQEREIEASSVPRDLADRLIGIANDPASQKFTNGLDLPSGSVLSGNVVVMGPVRLGGRVEGELIVVNGDVEFAPGAAVTGDLTVVGGEVRGGEEAALGGTVLAFGPPRPILGDFAEAVSTDGGRVPNGVRRDFGDRGSSGLSLELGSYNRVEGLPVRFGPSARSGGSAPFRFDAGIILRTEGAIPFQNDRYGFWARAEQFVGGGRQLRVGGGVFSRVEAIESMGISDDENALSTFLLTRDQRDHLERWGWNAFVRATPRALPVDLTVEFRNEEMGSIAERDPWSVFDNDRAWRLQPLVAEGSFRSIRTRIRMDTRDRGDEPANGWLIDATWTEGIGGDFAVPTTGVTPPTFAAEFSHAVVDARRYNRVGGAYLTLRGVLGGAPNGEVLPPQYQHALGGVGSLPAFPAFRADCGARTTVVTYAEGAGSRPMYPFYGCDRFALFQAEFRGGVPRFGRGNPSPSWVVFFDAGRGWSHGDWGGVGRPVLPVLYDGGIGFLLGEVGIYWAHPFGEVEGENTITLRMGRRF